MSFYLQEDVGTQNQSGFRNRWRREIMDDRGKADTKSPLTVTLLSGRLGMEWMDGWMDVRVVHAMLCCAIRRCASFQRQNGTNAILAAVKMEAVDNVQRDRERQG